MGHDWAEDHHDIALIDNDGRRVASARVPEGVAGVTRLQEILAGHDIAMGDIVVGTETDRGLFIGALIAGGAEVYAVNPKVAERYRDRIRPSGTKSDTLDALVLAEMVRTDRHLHRPVAADSAEVEALKVLARGHKELIWRRQQIVSQLRAALRDFYPAALVAFGTDLAHPDAWPLWRRRRTRLWAGGSRSVGWPGCYDGVAASAAPTSELVRFVTDLRADYLQAPEVLAAAYAGTAQRLGGHHRRDDES